MSKSLRVTEAEYRSSLRLIGELSELPRDSEARSQHLLGGLCNLVGARAGTDVTSRLVRNGPKAREVCTGGVLIGLYDDELRVIAGYLRDLDPPDPLAMYLYPKVGNGQILTLTRQEVMSDAAWRNCAHYNELRVPGGIAEPLIHSRPADGLARGSIRTFCLHRAPGERPFSRRQARLIGMLVDEALSITGNPAVPAEAPAESPGPDPAETLSPRERDVLDCLLRGDSIKEAAGRLSLSVHTVGDYVKALYRKFGVNSRPELLARWHAR